MFNRQTAGERSYLAPVYGLLIAIVLAATVASVVWRDVDLVARFGPNIATESLGILLTVMFVRRFMEQAERSRRLRSSAGALRKTRRALQDVVDVWCRTLKGCMSERPAGDTISTFRVLTPHVSEQLLVCDPTRVLPHHPRERWVSHLSNTLRQAQLELDRIVSAYGGMLDPEYIEALDGLIADPLVIGIEDLASAETEPQAWRVALNAMRGLRTAHFERLVDTVELHNRLAFDAGRVRGRTATPRSSLLGVQLAPHHDLVVDTVLDDGWWRSPPHVGSLRLA